MLHFNPSLVASKGFGVEVMNSRNKEVVKFLLAGSFNTLFCYLLFSFFVYSGAGPVMAMTISSLVTVGVGFFVMARFVFECAPTVRRSKLFVAMQVVGYVINMGFLNVLSYFGVFDYFAGLISLLCTAVFTFFISKYIVFVKKVNG